MYDSPFFGTALAVVCKLSTKNCYPWFLPIGMHRPHSHTRTHACSEATASQPVHHREGGEGVDGVVGVESFTQPSRFDELIVGTQIPCTPGASQVPSMQMPCVFTLYIVEKL